MKIISTYSRAGGMLHHEIYENVQEAEAAKITVVALEDAQKGDYVKTHNGFYVPVLHRYEIMCKNRKVATIRFDFPKFKFVGRLTTSTHRFAKKPFVYPTEAPMERFFADLDEKDTWDKEEVKTLYKELIDRKLRKPKFVSNQMKHFALLIGQGFDAGSAFDMAYPTVKSRSKKNQVIHQIFDSSAFQKYVSKEKIMDKLLKTLQSKGLNEEFIADRLMEGMQSDNAAMKKWATEYAIKLMDKDKVTKKAESDDGKVSKKIAAKVSQMKEKAS